MIDWVGRIYTLNVNVHSGLYIQYAATLSVCIHLVYIYTATCSVYIHCMYSHTQSRYTLNVQPISQSQLAH